MFYAWVALFGVVVWRFIAAQSARLRHDQMPVSDDEASAIQELGLAGAARHVAQPDEQTTTPRAARPLSDGVLSGRLFGGPLIVESDSVSQVPSIEHGFSPALRRAVTASAGAADHLHQDLIYGLRRLRANPGFTLFSVFTLALGIGATTAIYSVIYSTILRPLDVPDVDRVVNVYHSNPGVR